MILSSWQQKHVRTPSIHRCRIFTIGLAFGLLALSLVGCSIERNTATAVAPRPLPTTRTFTPSPYVSATASITPIPSTTASVELLTEIPAKISPTRLPSVYEPIEKLEHFTTIEDLQPTMIDNSLGWAVGGPFQDPRHILRTEDGGWTWRDVTPPALAPAGRFQSRTGAFFLDESHAWVVFQDRYLKNHSPEPVMVWRTKDGGESWTPSQPLDLQGFDGFIVDQNKMVFTDTLNGWIFASDPVPPRGGNDRTHIFHTTDGGNTWRRLSFDLAGDGYMLNYIREEKFMIAPGGIGFAQIPKGLPPYLLWTGDGGMNWSKVIFPTPEWAPDFFEVRRSSSGCLTDDSDLLASGSAFVLIDCGKPDGPTFAIYRSTDGAQTWEALSVPELGARRSLIDFLDNDNGWIAGPTIYKTQDGGITWQAVKQVSWDYFLSFQFVNQQYGWATVERNPRSAVIVWAFVRTKDGGRTWEQLVPRVVAESD